MLYYGLLLATIYLEDAASLLIILTTICEYSAELSSTYPAARAAVLKMSSAVSFASAESPLSSDRSFRL